MNISDRIQTNVYEETFGSDRYPILSTLTITKQSYTKKSFNITSKRTNWEKVAENLKNNFETFFKDDYCNSTASGKYRIFIETIK